MNDTVPATFLTQWIALDAEKSRLQQQVTEGAMERSELKQENKSLGEKYAELKQEYTELTKKYSELKEKYDELKEENHDNTVELREICNRRKNEFGEALKEIERLRTEHSDYEREMTTSIKKVQQELAEALETKRNTLLDEFFNLSTCECDLIGLYKYCRVYRVPEDVRLSVLAYDAREELVLPDTLEKDVRGGTVEEFLEWMVVPLPKLGRVMGYFRGVVDFYVQYKHGTIPLPLFKSFCAGCGVKGGYCFTKDDLLTVTSVGTCLDYFTTVLPLLPGVTWVQFPDFGEYTLPEDRSTMTGGGSVGEFLATVVDLLPEPKCVRGFSKDLVDDYLAYKAGNISHDVLEAFCYNNKVIGLTVCPTKVISTGVHPVEFCETMLPILPTVNTIIVGERLDTIGWCAILPKRITGMDLRYCRDLKDFSPLLGMNQLTTVVYHDKTNPSFQTIMEALRNKGVSVELKEYGK